MTYLVKWPTLFACFLTKTTDTPLLLPKIDLHCSTMFPSSILFWFCLFTAITLIRESLSITETCPGIFSSHCNASYIPTVSTSNTETLPAIFIVLPQIKWSWWCLATIPIEKWLFIDICINLSCGPRQRD